jgi:hypothetical protein
MMTPKALAQLRRDYTQAQQHLAFLERCAASDPAHLTPSILLATPDMLAVARAKVADLERWLADNTPQLALFDMPESKGADL